MKRTSTWQYFRFKLKTNKEPNNTNEAACKLCLMKVAESECNTCNLHTHLQVYHKSEDAKMSRGQTHSISKHIHTGDEQYDIVCDIPGKKLPTIRICHPAMITINSSWRHICVCDALTAHSSHAEREQTWQKVKLKLRRSSSLNNELHQSWTDGPPCQRDPPPS